MHIPDGFLDTRTIVATTALSTASLGIALRSAGSTHDRRRVPLMGVAAAFVFAAQMINFPVAAGTSGHLMGGVLAAVLLGPAAGVIVMASVLIVQCLLFADGGLLTLGANIFNMGVVGAVGGYGVYRLLRRFAAGERGRLMSASFAAWFSTVAAAVVTAGELAWSGAAPWNAVFPAMAGVHMLIGLGEGIVTALVLAAVASARPELLDESGDPSTPPFPLAGWGYALLISIGLALFVSPFASGWPDGLERVASSLGFDQRGGTDPLISAPLADYLVPGIGSPAIATALAGLTGTAVAFGLSYLLARSLVPVPRRES